MNEFTVKISGLTSVNCDELTEMLDLFFLRNKLFEATSGEVHEVDVYEVSTCEDK